jgi:predicted porin
MQKKLIAVAVGGALTAIGAPALAQNATVNVYGTFYGEYSRINNGRNPAGQDYQTYDHFQNPGSEIGFRGEEKLGGGMSAWFQCATSVDYRGGGNTSSTNNQSGSYWCSRNSALGLKGGFGNVFYGNWQTPFTRINSAGNVGSNDTGIWGNAHIMTGTSSTFGIAAPGQNINTLSPAVYRRRQNNLFTYETPNFGGFTAMGAVTTRNYASAATPAQLKARLYSIGAQYANGPIFVGAAYEVHDNFYNRGSVAVPNAGDDKAWTVAAAYTLPIRLKLGGSIVQTKSDAVLNAQTKVTSFHFGIDWMISGPHGVRLGYSRAGDVKGPTGTPMNARPAAGPNTKADRWAIRYVYALSKRTEVTAGYSRNNNRANANYETGGSSTAQQAGSDSSAFGVAVRHTF